MVEAGDSPPGETPSEWLRRLLDGGSTEAPAQTGASGPDLPVRGAVGGHPLIAAAADLRLAGNGSGPALDELVALAAARALREGLPLLVVTAPGPGHAPDRERSKAGTTPGAAEALARLDDAGILTVWLAAGPPHEGVAVSPARLCDVVVAESGGRPGPASTAAERLLAQGFVDAVRPRDGLRETLARLLAAAGPPDARATAAPPPAPAPRVLIEDPAELPRVPVRETLRRARHVGRPTTLDYLRRLFAGFQELHGDRAGGDCPSIVGGPACLDGTPVMVVGTQKGHTAEELRARNYGRATPAGYRKFARLLRLAGKLGLPVVAFIDTPGAFPGLEAGAGERGRPVVVAEVIRLMAELPVPLVTLVTGEGGSGGALALAVADRVLVCAHSVYSVISPEGCAAILRPDPATDPPPGEALRVDAEALLRLGVADAVVPEPEGGAHTDPARAAAHVHAALTTVLDGLRRTPAPVLVAERYARFRAFGDVESFAHATEEAMRP
ncbi:MULTISPECIES: carboxyl transferase domain-containing protein [Streptomyces]|uniref:carboxyl transferase domain-containing protein n=1 Tax=Streptomyces TaxID=1883 RepID=UPI00163CCB27|nr:MULTISPECIES: carboxyl transferase domain-containing protein [Streptomyces]MBC2876896.1 acetyl-CoA carboxylase carboxyl transferase subunit beta [Streptomyces sp. TYQ1024]UBI35924.1 acetyl-CoA carboxylase carboxyl transferase subunit beta [Streptomyces mobaraensis]UKW28517.1 acetyl-CoA carboxylase carboxyl transferase subunit beta [Streptomyces sp. TYQ1024]